MYLESQLMQFSLRPILFQSKFGVIRTKLELLQSLCWKQKLCFYKIMYLFAIVFISPQVEHLTTVQQGDRNHWRNREWNADAKISCYRCNTSRKECLFSVKRSNNENFLTWIYGTFCVCVWEHIAQYWFLKFLIPIPYKIWKFRVDLG